MCYKATLWLGMQRPPYIQGHHVPWSAPLATTEHPPAQLNMYSRLLTAAMNDAVTLTSLKTLQIHCSGTFLMACGLDVVCEQHYFTMLHNVTPRRQESKRRQLGKLGVLRRCKTFSRNAVVLEISVLQRRKVGKVGSQCFGTLSTYTVFLQTNVLQRRKVGEVGPQCSNALSTYMIPADIEGRQIRKAGEVGPQCSGTLIPEPVCCDVVPITGGTGVTKRHDHGCKVCLWPLHSRI